MPELRSAFGMVVLLGIAYLISENRRKISWRLVLWALALQVLLALLVLKTSAAAAFFSWMNSFFVKFYDFVGEGARFVFGDLVKEVPFAFHVLPTVLLFAALFKLLYHLGVIHPVVYGVGLVMNKTMKTSGAESLSAAANIFMGQTEAPLVVKPYIAKMTRSELMAIMVPGMASTAGGVMAAYIAMLSKHFPDIAGHLMAQSIMSAPAGLLFAKMFVPETETPATSGKIELKRERECDGVFHALSVGTKEGVELVANIAAMLIVFIAIIAGLNFVWGAGCGFGTAHLGIDTSGVDTLQEILGYLFAPFAWLMGVPTQDLLPAGMLIGEKTVLNEFIAYGHLGEYLGGKPIAEGIPWHALDQRTVVILSYALSGFSNFASIGILVGGLGVMAPGRMGEIAKLGLKCLVAATFACFMTASIAAILL